VAVDNVEVLRQNGFEVEADDDVDPSSGKVHRLHLIAQPVSKSTVFDIKGMLDDIYVNRVWTGLIQQRNRFRGTYSLTARSTDGTDGQVLQSSCNVCYAGLQEERDGRDAAEQKSNDCGTGPEI
jgi:hypothetical protein